MADRKSKRGAEDREVGGSEGYEVSYFAEKHGITIAQARALIQRVGNDRAKLDAAEKLATR